MVIHNCGKIKGPDGGTVTNIASSSRTSIGSRLKRFGDVKEEPRRTVIHVPKQIHLTDAWVSIGEVPDAEYKMVYDRAIELLSHLKYSVSDIKEFIITLSAFAKEQDFESKAGIFISALINTSPRRRFSIQLDNLPPLHRLGYMNTKSITITGDVGILLGHSMAGGYLRVHGNAGNWLGYGMSKGKISVSGSISGLSDSIQSGVIYQNGKKLWENHRIYGSDPNVILWQVQRSV